MTASTTAPTGVRRAAVLGHPIEHSLSPALHRAAYEELGLDWQYEPVDVDQAALPEFLNGLGPEWVGLSLTMPLKEIVIELLDDVDPVAAAARAVNTVVFDAGRRRGFNTDITGLVGLLQDLERDNALRSFSSSSAVVIGAGATARSAVSALARLGGGRLGVTARRPEASAELVDFAVAAGMAATAVRWPPQSADLAADLVISTVPAETGGELAVPASPGVLVDVLYDPWPTALARRWEGAGGRVVGGLELLVRQAVEQVELMTGRRPDPARMRRAGELALRERSGVAEIAQADQ